MQQYSIRDDASGNVFVFEADELGSADSKRPKSQRWTEVYVYLTSTGKYVAHLLGCSNIFHTLEGAMTSNERTGRERNCSSGRLRRSEYLHEDAVPCTVCTPDRLTAEKVREEEDRSSVVVSDTPEELIERLTATDQQGERYLSKVTRRALEEASDRVPALEPSSKVEQVVTI